MLDLKRLATLMAAAAAVAACAVGRPGADAEPEGRAGNADLVLRGGPVYTVDAARTWARAVAIRNGQISYVGTERGVKAHIGADTRVVELNEKMVLPSFQDSHIHPIDSGTNVMFFVTLSEFSTQEEYLAEISRYAEAHPDVEWISGDGWLISSFEGGIPTAAALDEIIPDRPVYIMSGDGHSAWVNSRALELSGVTKDTPDPPNGRIDRDPETGEPVGALQESAMDLIHVPPATPDQRADGLRYALRMLNGYGITGFQSAIVNPEDLETYRRLNDQGELTARVVAAMWWEDQQGMEQVDQFIAQREQFSSGRFQATSVKIMQDGVLENYTAALVEP